VPVIMKELQYAVLTLISTLFPNLSCGVFSNHGVNIGTEFHTRLRRHSDHFTRRDQQRQVGRTERYNMTDGSEQQHRTDETTRLNKSRGTELRGLGRSLRLSVP